MIEVRAMSSRYSSVLTPFNEVFSIVTNTKPTCGCRVAKYAVNRAAV